MKLPFQTVCYLHVIDQSVRLENFTKEYNRLKIENNINIINTSRLIISDSLETVIPTLRTPYYNRQKTKDSYIYNKVFNCALAHYNCIKMMYQTGSESLLIFEDDTVFIDDINIIQKTVEQIPSSDDYDLIKLHCSFYDYPETNPGFENVNNKDKTWIGSTMCYGLSKRGMEQAIDIYERGFRPSDMILSLFDDKSRILVSNNRIIKNNFEDSLISPLD